MRIYLNDHWLFTRKFTEAFLTGSPAGEQVVRIPHTVTETSYDYFDETEYQMISGYKRNVFIEESASGQSVVLHFEAVAHGAEVFVNGLKVCEHHCGYTAFEADISEVIRFGKDNTVCLKCNSKEDQDFPPFGFVIDYMTYGGIYRDVWLDIRPRRICQGRGGICLFAGRG